MNVRRLTPVLALFICAAAGHAADLPATLPADFAVRMQLLRQQLASGDFAQREAAQRELEKISPSQLELLQVVAAAEMDPEIKARLEARISDMQLHLIIHPAPISLNVDNAPLRDVAAALQTQIKDAIALQSGSTFGAVAANDPKFTLHADKQPFWQIFQDLNRQNPLTVSPTLTASTGAITLRLQSASPANARTFTPLGDAFACIPDTSGRTSGGAWVLGLTFYTDPRIRIIQYSPLQIDKITDQDGRNLFPFLFPTTQGLSTLSRPAIYWTSTAILQTLPGVQKLAELRGKVTIILLEHEQTATLDLTQRQVPPLQTPRGQISYEAAGANMVLRLTPHAADKQPAGGSGIPLSIRVFDANGVTLNAVVATGPSLSVSFSAGRAAKAEVTWPDKTREYMLPFVLKDVDRNAPAPIGGVRGGAIVAN